MDHFNATVKDGKLVNTRRGLQVSRQKFNGLSFVNSCPQTSEPEAGPSATPDPSRPPHQRQLKFVGKDSDGRQGTAKAQRQDSERPDTIFITEGGQGKKPRRRITQKDQHSSTPSASLSRRSSRASSYASSPGEGSFHAPLPFKNQDTFQPESRTDNPTTYLPTWPTNEPQAQLSEDDWKLFHRYFMHIPRRIYPYEDILTYNPARGDDFHYMTVKDIAALHCVLMCGTITEAVINSETNPKGFAYHISKICAILNRKLDQKQSADAVTLHCIATLASMGCYVGRLDHWHMHMRGLQKVLDVSGGGGVLQPWLLAKMHKADLKGAVSLASSPYLPFTRRYGPVTNIVPDDVRNHDTSAISAILVPLQIDPGVITSMCCLSAFTSAVRLARTSSGTVKFDPHAFTEEWLAVTHALVTRPGPLRAQPVVAAAASPRATDNPYSSGGQGISGGESDGTAARTTENYVINHRLRHDVPIIPNGPLGLGGPAEPALRVAALLYLKELLPDWPRNLGGYAVLLSLLRVHLRDILATMGDGVGSHRGESYDGETKEEDHDENPFLDPLLKRDSKNAGANHQGEGKAPPGPSDGRTSPEPLKPVLIFLCVLGNLLSQIGDENEGRYAPGDRYPRAIFQHCLQEVLGLTGPHNRDDGGAVDDIVAEADLVLLRRFELRNIRGEGWDDWAALRGLLAEEMTS